MSTPRPTVAPPNDEERRLISLVRAGDEAARGVYADWLEEHGQDRRASLMRDARPLGEAFADLARWVFDVCDDSWYEVDASRGCRIFATEDDIPPTREVQISYPPRTTPFRPTRIIVPDDVAPHFSLSDVRVGHRPQRLEPGAIPCSALTFAANKVSLNLYTFETVQVAMDLTLVARNTSSEPRRFLALVLGRIPEELTGRSTWR